MKWADAYILYLPIGDYTSSVAAWHYKMRYNIPDNKCFSYEAIPGFSPISDGCLSSSTLYSKIIIIGHSDRFVLSVGHVHHGGGAFALFLRRALGLRDAGVLSFKTCLLGAGRFLDDFKMFIGCMRIGFLIACLDNSHLTVLTNGWVIQSVGDADRMLRTYTWGERKLEDKYRVRVVKGNYSLWRPYIYSHRFI